MDSYTEKFITLDVKHPRRPLVARNGEKANQLALIYAAAKYGPDKSKLRIDSDAANWAIGIVNWCTGNVLAAIDIYMADSLFEKRQQELMKFIYDHSSASERWVRKKTVDSRCRLIRSLSRRDYEEMLGTLRVTGQLSVYSVKNQRGKPSVYFVIPKHGKQFEKKFQDATKISEECP